MPHRQVNGSLGLIKVGCFQKGGAHFGRDDLSRGGNGGDGEKGERGRKKGR